MALAKIEDLLELPANYQLVQNGAERAEWRHIMHQIVHLRVLSAKRVLVVPHAIRTDPLFIDKIMRRAHLCDSVTHVRGTCRTGETR